MLLIEWRRLAVGRTAELVEELERSNEAKTEFVQHVSHELRTPMTIIEGNASMLARRWQALDDDQRGGCLEDIVDATKRLESITTNLLSLARLGAGYEVEREPVVIAHVVASVVALHREGHPERRYELVADGERDPVTCAPVYLMQVVENLLTNAEKYSPAEGEITVHVERSGRAVRVSVLDRGQGIHPDEAATLFEPFYRGADRGEAPGLGIGLAVCKRFAESEGGAMSAAPRDGGGAEFAITLPVTETDDDLPPDGRAREPERTAVAGRRTF
jgi:signal transduction histidine kinase